MDIGINIGNSGESKTIREVAEALALIFDAGHEFRMDQATIVEALDAFRAATQSPTHASINNCNLTSNYVSEDED